MLSKIGSQTAAGLKPATGTENRLKPVQVGARSVQQSSYLSSGFLTLLLCLLLLLTGCSNGMEVQPKYEPLAPSEFFEDGASARPLTPNTVARGLLMSDTLLYEGRVDGALAQEFPFPVTAEVMARGQERYNIFCSPCHGYSGYGDGRIVQRGLTPPPSFHNDRLRSVPDGYFFEVITNGFGAMYNYGDRVQPEDRWAIIAYVRALQLSQNATLEDVPAEMRAELEAATE
jgi:mono/diheme cytochrome c family protein